MRVWLITVGEPLPTDPGCERLLRTGLLAETLAAGGHDVLWWTSSFDHVAKRPRESARREVVAESSLSIRLLDGIEYRRNLSIRRVLNHRGVARDFRASAPSEPEPDVILCSLPLTELAEAATEFGRQRGIPVVLDVRDMWPDAIVDLAPRGGQWLANVLLRPMNRAVSNACAGATAICGITDPIVDWALAKAGRRRRRLDCSFPLGYRQRPPSDAEIADAQRFWRSRGVSGERGDFIICFFGTIGRRFEFDLVNQAARKLAASGRQTRFVLCGCGPRLKRCRRKAAGIPNVLFPGWVNAAQIWTLMRMSSAGVAPYISTWDFVISIPNKPIEYLSAGLPVISSLRGVLAELLAANDCGVTYTNGDADGLADAISFLYDRPDHRRRMSENALAVFREKFVAEHVYSRMKNYLEEIAAHFAPGENTGGPASRQAA